jgi:hypothetical protein
MTQPTLFDTGYGEGPPRRTGHAAPPGTGPAGETCGTCRHFYHEEIPVAMVIFTCRLCEKHWGDGATDIRASDPACRCWEAKEESE